jgi:hypothetical protein
MRRHAGCRRGSLRAISTVSSSASIRLSCGSSRAAATAATTFLRWIAFWKIPYERPCEVDLSPLRGRDGMTSVRPEASREPEQFLNYFATSETIRRKAGVGVSAAPRGVKEVP